MILMGSKVIGLNWASLSYTTIWQVSYANIATAPAKTPKAPSIMSTCAVGLATATPVEEEVAAAVIELTALLV